MIKKIKKELLAWGYEVVENKHGLCVENNILHVAFDYYEFNYPWINNYLMELAEKNNMYWEWVNPHQIVLVE